MKTWPRISIPLACALVAAVALMYVSRDREPYHDGRSLSDWLEDLTDHSPEGEPELAEGAIGQIGTNAIPFLVRYGSDAPPLWWLKSGEALEASGAWLGCDWGAPWRRREARRDGALMALGILGNKAVSTIPELTQLMNSPGDYERAKLATYALGCIGPEALPPLMTVLTNPQSPMRGMAALNLSMLGTNARPAVPILIGYLQDPSELAACAAVSLGRLQQEPRVVVPALVHALEDPRHEVREAALIALGEFGSQADSAVPALVKLLDNTDERLRQAATNVLSAITPETLTNALLSVKTK